MTSHHHFAPSAVRLKGIHKSYRSGSVITPVLRGIDLAIRTDQLSVLAGPSGCGKTTLLNLIGCIDRPDQGEIEVLGQRVQTLNDNALSDFRRDQIGFVFQNFNLLPVLTAYENVEYPLILAGINDGRHQRVLEALDQVGLANEVNQYPGQLSGGQRQRVAIARALVKSPRLVLADEPTANLDAETSNAIITLIRTQQQHHHIAFVISSHDAAVQAHADCVLPILNGRLPESCAASRLDPAPALALSA